METTKAKLLIITVILLLLMPVAVSAEIAADIVSVDVNGISYYENEQLLINGVTYVQYEDYLNVISSDKKIDFEISINTDYNCIIANDRYLYFGSNSQNIDGNLYLPIRTVSKIFDADINWNGSLNKVTVTTGTDYLENGETYYNYDDLYWLSRIIYAESGAEPFAGKLAVGTVIMNRVASNEFPNDIYGVIFDAENGVQFPPSQSNRIYTAPDEESVIAAKICLDGYRTDTAILYFLDESIAVNKWIVNNRDYSFTIGCHDFYS